jgi:hypothetical protein
MSNAIFTFVFSSSCDGWRLSPVVLSSTCLGAAAAAAGLAVFEAVMKRSGLAKVARGKSGGRGVG